MVRKEIVATRLGEHSLTFASFPSVSVLLARTQQTQPQRTSYTYSGCRPNREMIPAFVCLCVWGGEGEEGREGSIFNSIFYSIFQIGAEQEQACSSLASISVLT